MTVCVATISSNNTIFGAADRMLTAGDIQFEPQQPKIVGFTNSIGGLIAGDSALQAEILLAVSAEIRTRLEAQPNVWLNVGDVADLCSRYYRQARLRRTERTVLSPLGLDNNTFISRQKELQPQFVTQIAKELYGFELPAIQTIIAGIDLTGPHLYVINGADVSCHDQVGFAAIGAGYWHSDSVFMFAGHTRAKPSPDTLLLTYVAKKRAEVAPGVGEATDMFIIGPNIGSYRTVPPDVLENLERIYRKNRKRTAVAVVKSNAEVNQYVQQLTAATTRKGYPSLSE